MSVDEKKRHPKGPALLAYEILRTEQREQWRDALWQRQQLFQDVVCYYVILLAGVAGEAKDEKGRLLNPL